MSRWIDQTEFGDEGNCVQAAIASILGLRLEEVPNFIKLHPGDSTESVCEFWDAVEDFLEDRGWWFKPIPMGEKEGRPDVPYLATGKTVRGFNHMVVMKGHDMIHDPHPDRDGLIKADHGWLLVPLDPALFVLKRDVPRRAPLQMGGDGELIQTPAQLKSFLDFEW